MTGDPKTRICPLTAHSLRKFFMTQMISPVTESDFAEYMMGHTLSDYDDIKIKGVEFFRGTYSASGVGIRSRTKASKMFGLMEISHSW
jgi:hypothetical protein